MWVYTEDIKPLEDWVTATEAAEILNLSRQEVHRFIRIGRFPLDDLRTVGDTAKMLLLRRSRVLTMRDDRLATAQSHGHVVATIGPVSPCW